VCESKLRFSGMVVRMKFFIENLPRKQLGFSYTISHLSAPPGPIFFFSSSHLLIFEDTFVNQLPKTKLHLTTNAPKKKLKNSYLLLHPSLTPTPLTPPLSTTSHANNPTPPPTRHLSDVSPTPSNSISQKKTNPASYCCSSVSCSFQFFSVCIWQMPVVVGAESLPCFV
jgi:hypothetical protein